MSLSDAIEDMANVSLIQDIRMNVVDLLQKNKIQFDPSELIADQVNGLVTVDGKYTFTMVDRHLRLIVPCPKCSMDVPSTPIYSISDIAIQTKEPKPMKHACLDV